MGPLEGVNVLDLSAVVSGPLTATLLADQGAAVIKVEKPGGDIQRNVGSKRHGYSGSFHMLNRGKRSIAVDLGDKRGQAIVAALAADADVVVQNFRPGVVDRLGIGYSALSAINPALVYLSISGFGASGPHAGKRAYDPIIQTFSGLADVQGQRRGDGPEQVNQLIMDKLTAYTGCQAITAALYRRQQDGGAGQHIELSMLDTALAFMWPDAGADSILLGDDIDHHQPIRAAGVLAKVKDGHAAMMTLSDQEFAGLCRALSLDAVASDPRFNSLQARQQNRQRYVTEVRAQIEEAAKDFSLAELEALMTAENVPFARAQTLDDLPADPQAQHNEMFFKREHPVAGLMRETRPAPRFSGTPATGGGFAPGLGEHTREILQEAGFGDDIETLFAEGIVE